MNERNGNSVGGCSRDVARANSTQPNPIDFRGRCSQKIEKVGGILRDSKKHGRAGALSLNPTNNDIPLKRSNEVWSVFYS